MGGDREMHYGLTHDVGTHCLVTRALLHCVCQCCFFLSFFVQLISLVMYLISLWTSP